MTAWLDKLLGLRQLSLSGEGVGIEFAHALPAWAWVLVGGALASYAAWSYWKLLGNRAARTGLALVRTLLLLTLAVLIAGPQVVRQVERIEKDWVVVLLDRSASMQVRDGVGAGGERVTREAQQQAALAAASPALERLRQERNVLALGFDAGAFEVPLARLGGSASDALGQAKGARTALGVSIDEALKKVAARPVAGLIVMSDGRSFDSPSRSVMQELEDRQIGVYPLALGSKDALADVSIARVDAPQAAFVGDLVPVVVDVDALGRAAGSASPGGAVELVGPDGAILDTQPLPAISGDRTRVTLTTKATTPGQRAWTVRLKLDQPDLTEENNSMQVAMDLVDRPLRVLYIDGTPRWEYRYLKNLLQREASIRSTTLLLAAEKRFIQEGTDRLAAMPVTAQDWAVFDVIIMGDVRPGLFSQEQLRGLRDLVAVRGGGLLWIGGASFTPTAWPGTALADVLPFRVESSESDAGVGGAGLSVATSQQALLMLPGPAASVYGLLKLDDDPTRDWPTTLSDPALRWPLLRWSQRIDPRALKPSAEVLAVGQPIAPDGSALGQPTPLVLTMRYGAGRAAYVATDETWRYRYGRGEALTERFWIPLVRLLARGSLGRSGRPALLEASPELVMTNQPVRIELTLLDQSLVEKRAGDTQVRIVRGGAAGQDEQEASVTLVAQAQGGAQGESSASLASFAGVWVPGEPGEYRITPMDAALSALDISARVRVVVPEDELRRPQTDHPALEQLAAATGGSMLTMDQLASLDTLLPNRQVRVLGTPEVETLWDKPIALVLVMLLLTLEWAGRRLIKLS